MPPLEIWGGLECSVVRLVDRVENQLARTGHAGRLGDLDRIASLGVRTLRYPLLWELHARHPIDWRWADERLNRLRSLGIRPILGFVHHGGGPLPGGLLDDGFVDGLARFAAQVAQRYPWIDAYTPVNEPLTTARFSGLYHHWHPHGRSVACFVACLLQECRAVRAAMQAIRRVNPAAALVQTEDIGKTHSTPRLAYQADYENERRWTTFDLLSGRLGPGMAMWGYLRHGGATEADLQSFLDDPCPPDVYGMNHYVTSERFLDDDVSRYPDHLIGGNERERYADLPAVRVRAEGLLGPTGLLLELWDRYRRPLAVTEVQLACTREEQVRWLLDFWRAAQRVRAAGADLRAITPWALFGAYDWDSLLLRADGHYEAGAFDVRGPQPRPTALARAISSIAGGGTFAHPITANRGWWRRPVRLEHRAVSAPATGRDQEEAPADADTLQGPPILVAGAGGRISRALASLGRLRGLPIVSWDRAPGQGEAPRPPVEPAPWAVIDATLEAWEQGPVPPEAVDRSSRLAAYAHERALPCVTLSDGRVFGRPGARPWRETDEPAPTEPDGRALRLREQVVQQACPAVLIVRGGALYQEGDYADVLGRLVRELRTGRRVTVAGDAAFSPTFLPEFLHAVLDLLIDGESGIWHLVPPNRATATQWFRQVAAGLGLEATLVQQGVAGSTPPPPPLGSERGWLLRPWEEPLARVLASAGETGSSRRVRVA